MRDILLFALAAAALLVSVLSYQRTDELYELVTRLNADSGRELIERNRVLTLGARLENMMRSVGSSGKKSAAPAQ
jgi:hypothetical protein